MSPPTTTKEIARVVMLRMCQARPLRLSSLRLGISRNRACSARAAVPASSNSFTPTKMPIGLAGLNSPLKPGEINRAHPQTGKYLNGQGREPQRLKDLLESADLGSALCSQGPGEHPQIQHQMPTGPHRGGQGMNNHQQRKNRHGSSFAGASTMGAMCRV